MADHPKRPFFPYRPYLRPTGRLPAAFSGASRRQPPLEIGAEMLRLRRAMARTGLESVRLHANRWQTASEHQCFGPYCAFLHECCRYPVAAVCSRSASMTLVRSRPAPHPCPIRMKFSSAASIPAVPKRAAAMPETGARIADLSQVSALDGAPRPRDESSFADADRQWRSLQMLGTAPACGQLAARGAVARDYDMGLENTIKEPQ